MIYSNSTAVPREELAAVVVQGRGFNAQNIWQDIFPLFAVNDRNVHIVQMNIAGAELLRVMDKQVAPGSNIERVVMNFDGTTTSIAIRKEEVLVPDEVEKDFDQYFSTEAVAAQIGTEKLELTGEYLAANAIFNSSNFAATNSAVAYTVANLSTISFVADIYAAIEKVRGNGEMPNTIVIPIEVYQRIRQATLVQGFIRGTLQPGYTVTDNTIKQAFADEGIEKVLIGRSRYNNATRGAAPSISLIWSNSYIWVGRTGGAWSEKDGGMETVAGVGGMLYWDKFGGPWQTMTYRAEERASNVVRAQTSCVPYVANTNSGTLINTQYS